MADDKDDVTEAGEDAAAEPRTPEAGADPEAARIAELEALVAELKDQQLRALAEAENVRRRARREQEDTAKYAASSLARELLNVPDNLRRAIESVPAEARSGNEQLETLLCGVEMIERELLAALEKHAIRKVDPAGTKFDHNLHQAMFEVENSGQPAGTVVQVMQPGYVLHDRLLRPALVGVAKGDPAAAEQTDTDTAG